jgi:uncharacterized RDD family membrane protein YckC
MKQGYVEVLTTQNVTIKYEFAEIFQRIASYIVDLIVMSITALVIYFGVTLISGNMVSAYYIFFLPIILFYTLIFELFNNGQTLGKKALGIKVMRIDGSEPEVMDYIVRWIFSPADYILSLGILATVMIKITKNHQRLGDIVAGTTVIRIKPSRLLKLENLISIGENIENYEISYPEVRKYNEEQLIIIKRTIDRYIGNPNLAHSKALIKLVNKLIQNIDPKQQLTSNELRINFLKTVINDYVMLTR